MNDYSEIFNGYLTENNIPYYNISKSIVFPNDESLDIYELGYINEDTPWTILSYKLYGTIDYWWVLCSLNKDKGVFYAKKDNTITYIKPTEIQNVLSNA